VSLAFRSRSGQFGAMNPTALFIRRPVGTLLVVAGIVLAGLIAFFRLPVAPLPSLEIPVILVSAAMPGASPQTMATTVATPLERRLAQIADVTAVTSESNTGQTSIILQFGLGRDLDGAARDVQAAINAARADLPTALRANPTYRRFNPAGFPILLVSLSSATLTTGQLYDVANSVVAQKLSQVEGVGNVDIVGSSLPAVRVDLDPNKLFQYGIGLEDVRAALASANANSPKGAIEQNGRHFQLYANDQAEHAADYRGLIVAYRDGAGVRLSDVADVQDSVEDVRAVALVNGRPAVLLLVFRETTANIVQTVARVRAALPQLQAALPNDVRMVAGNDQSQTIRSALGDTEATLLIAVTLVVLVVFAFLRRVRTALIPTVAVPVSIIGTFGAMYLCGYTLDNLSLMALTISTGFVVDDAIVVLENVARYLESGMPRREAVLRGTREVAFTVVSISLSLVAVFLPILLMQGIAGRLFREFAVTLVLAILISMVLSLTATPVMCALLLPTRVDAQAGRIGQIFARGFDRLQAFYAHTLGIALRHRRLVLASLLLTIIANVVLFAIVPKGLFPQQDSDLLRGQIEADDTASFSQLRDKISAVESVINADPSVLSVQGFSGGRLGGNTMSLYVTLKPKGHRATDIAILARLRPKLADIAGANTVLQPEQDLPSGGGRQEAGQYQYTIEADTQDALDTWVPRLVAQMKKNPALADVSSDDSSGGLSARVEINRDSAARLRITPQSVDTTLYDAFGQRRVSTIFEALNQYSVIMELAPRYLTDLANLRRIYISTSGQAAEGTEVSNLPSGTVTAVGAAANVGAQTSARNAATNAIASAQAGAASAGAAVTTTRETMVPLSAIAQVGLGTSPTTVNHQSGFIAATISFNLNKGYGFADAEAAVDKASQAVVLPDTLHRDFAGNARELRDELGNQLVLVLAGLAAVYIVLGVLYESYIHPLTILSTLPSAGVGVVLALLVSHTEFSVIALIAVFLLIGIVKKNAILMIDFALTAERDGNLTPQDAIYQACLIRFRPIVMTTAAAILSALPLMLGQGDGAELRQPLGLSIVGGLLVSQVLTLYTTPVVYLYLDRMRLWVNRRWGRRSRGVVTISPAE
jgi:multidrug efflux pump